MMKVNNLPTNYKNHKYIVVRTVEGEDWYWGSWDEFAQAEAVAFQFDNGHVINSERVERGRC